jgi:hypothetical protein
MIARYLDGGEDLDGKLSDALLKSLFDPHSEGHDGALVISGNRITKFAARLPLSKNLKKLHGVGTRHAAALGLSELTDALCIAVSEERGVISVAWHGDLKVIQNPEALVALLQKFYGETVSSNGAKRWLDLFRKNLLQKISTFLFAAFLWFFLVHGSKPIYKSFTVPLEHTKLPSGLILATLEPKEVTVTFFGKRSDFYFLNHRAVRVLLKTLNAGKGRKTISLSSSDVTYPKPLVFESIMPSRAVIDIQEPAPAVPAKPKS